MENIFRPNKWFVGFCALLIVVWGGLQLVSNTRLSDEAKACALDVFTWDWPGRNWTSIASVSDANVLRKSDTDAIVRVRGKQVLTVAPAGVKADFKNSRSEEFDFAATLTFYRASNRWVLGKVDFE